MALPKCKTKRSILLAVLSLAAVTVLGGLFGVYVTRKWREREIAQGEALFRMSCCSCHNGRTSGTAKTPPNLAGIFRRPQLPSGAPATDEQVRSTILSGRSDIMPSFKGALSDEQISDITRYLHSVGPETTLCAAE